MLIPSSSGSSSTSLTLYYNAFNPPHKGGESLSLHIFKPPQSILLKSTKYGVFIKKMRSYWSLMERRPNSNTAFSRLLSYHGSWLRRIPVSLDFVLQIQVWKHGMNIHKLYLWKAPTIQLKVDKSVHVSKYIGPSLFCLCTPYRTT